MSANGTGGTGQRIDPAEIARLASLAQDDSAGRRPGPDLILRDGMGGRMTPSPLESALPGPASITAENLIGNVRRPAPSPSPPNDAAGDSLADQAMRHAQSSAVDAMQAAQQAQGRRPSPTRRPAAAGGDPGGGGVIGGYGAQIEDLLKKLALLGG